MSFFDQRSFRLIARGARQGLMQPARYFDWYRHQAHAAPQWVNTCMLFGTMFTAMIVGRGAEKLICRDQIQMSKLEKETFGIEQQ